MRVRRARTLLSLGLAAATVFAADPAVTAAGQVAATLQTAPETTRAVATEPVDRIGSPMSAGTMAAAESINVKVFLYVFDPVLENMGGKRLHAAYGWDDPVTLTAGVVGDLEHASHGVVNFDIVKTTVVDAYPRHVDGFTYTDAAWEADWATGTPHQSAFDWQWFLDSNGIVDQIDSGAIDEVWIYQDPLDQDSAYESTMAGDGAYWLNSPPVPGPNGPRAFAIMSWNYERGVAEALHSFGHRTESLLCHAYSVVDADACSSHALDTNWARFTAYDLVAPGRGGIGNIHFPVNGVADYDYSNARYVPSNADGWLSYPDRPTTTRLVNYTDWAKPGIDDHRAYMDWWFGHLPHAAGVNADGYPNDWWRMVMDVDGYKRAPAASMRTLPVYSLSSARRITWSGTSGSNQVASYDVRYRRAAWNGGFGGYATWLSATPATTAVFSAALGSTYCFSVRARDTIGFLSAWSSETCTAVPLDDRSLVRSTHWTAGTASAYYAGTYLRSSTYGARLTRTGVVTRRLSLIATTCPRCGSVRVYLGSTLLKSISLSSATTVYRKVIPIASFSATHSGTLTIRVVSSGRRVSIDGVAIKR
jgi:hypothetical protein